MYWKRALTRVRSQLCVHGSQKAGEPVSVDRCLDEQSVVHAHSGIVTALRKKGGHLPPHG